MEFPVSTNYAQAPDDDFILFNNLIASGTANGVEIEDADFSGLPPEDSVLSFPTRHSNARQSSLINGNGEIIGRESLAVLFFSPDHYFGLFNNLIDSWMANMDQIETAHFSGLPPEF